MMNRMLGLAAEACALADSGMASSGINASAAIGIAARVERIRRCFIYDSSNRDSASSTRL
jgi:hypothetical protein